MSVIRHCPTCGFAAADVWDEIAHMRSAHPEIIRERLERAGIMEDEVPLADQLAGAVKALQGIRAVLEDRDKDPDAAGVAYDATGHALVALNVLGGGSYSGDAGSEGSIAEP